MQNIIEKTHFQWQELLEQALASMDVIYLKQLFTNDDWLPGVSALFAAFRLPLSSTRFILFGESPYPRVASANGYAFWDNSVHSLWSDRGFSKEVNRATSLRNLIKMLLVARGDLLSDVSQHAIARLDNSVYVRTAEQLFQSFLSAGFLLLNASLVYRKNQVRYHAKQWQPFIGSLLHQLARKKLNVSLVLFGQIAKEIPKTELLTSLVAEHPYNISFIMNPFVLEFFTPMNLLSNHDN